MKRIEHAVNLIMKAQSILTECGDGLQVTTPGLVKELIIAKILHHRFIQKKHDADACHFDNDDEKYEYLSCNEKGSFQMDRMYGINNTVEQRSGSKHRIIRNKYFFHAIFYINKPLTPKEIYQIETDLIWEKAQTILLNPKNKSNHISFGRTWSKKVGKLVYKG
jgi:hypothetical protein